MIYILLNHKYSRLVHRVIYDHNIFDPFHDYIELLKIRGKAMQNAVPKGEGGMLAVLGSEIEKKLSLNWNPTFVDLMMIIV